MVSNPDFCNMVHLAPLTPAWPADLLGVALILIVKTRATVYNHVHTTCAQYIIMNAHTLALAQCASPRRMCLATKVNNVLPVQIRKCMENVTPSCRLLSLMCRTRPPLRDWRDNAKLACHCTARYKIEWIYMRTKVRGPESLELALEMTKKERKKD